MASAVGDDTFDSAIIFSMRLGLFIRQCVIKVTYPLLVLSSHSGLPLVVTALCGSVVAGAATPVESGAEVRSFDLPAGDAVVTLKQFSAAAGVPIVYLVDRVRGTTTNAVVGKYQPREALDRMLAGTVLEVDRDAATGALVVSRKRSTEAEPPTGKVGTVSPLQSPPKKTMTPTRKLAAAFAGWLALSSAASAQTTATPQNDEVLVLSPFEVTANSDVGYQARETLAGGRLRTQLKDISAQVDVMTAEYLSDLGITSLEDSLKYSLSIDNQSDWYEPGGSDTLGGNPFNPSAGNRARGLSRASTSVGYFETSTAIDSYNTERYTFVGGPNAVNFGNGLAGGSVDASFKRARTNSNKYSVSLQVDSEEGYRGTLDVNQVLIKDRLAMRFNALKQDIPAGRTPSYDRAERYFGTIAFEPHKRLRMRAYYEDAQIDKAPVRSTLVQDKVTPYLKALEAGSAAYTVGSGSSAITYPGRPAQPGIMAEYLRTYNPSLLLPYAFNNSAINSLNISANTTANNNARIAQGFTSAVSTSPNTDILSRLGTSNPVLVLGGTGPIPIMSWNNAGILQNGPAPFTTGPGGESFDWSFTDDSIYPSHINLVGNGLQQYTKSKLYGVVIEFNPIKDLFIEWGSNREFITYRFSDVLGQGNTELAIDLNQYLPAEWATGAPVPTRLLNPNFGRYYVTSGVAGGENGQEKADDRLTASYTLDFAKNKGWTRWLGVHRLLGVWTQQMSQRFEQVRQGASGAVVISDNAFTTSITNNAAIPLPNALVDVRAATRQLQVRNYLGSPTAGIGGQPYVDLNINSWDWGNMGVDVNGRPVVVSGEALPGGASTYPIGNGRKETESRIFSVQSSFIKDRLILSYGRRLDENSYTNWLDNDMQPRYDYNTGKFVIPTAPVSSTNLPHLQSAPWMPWQDFKKLGLDRILRTSSRQEESPTSDSKGIVVHPLNWLSVFYNESNSAYAAEFSLFNHNGTAATNDDGTGKDYGFAVSTPGGMFSMRVNWFESRRVGGGSSFQGNSGAGRKSLRDNIYYVEKTFLNVQPGFDVAGDQFAYYSGKVQSANYSTNINANTNFLGDSHPVANERSIFVQADRAAEGVEVTLTANPLRGLALSLRGAKNETRDSNIGLNWFEFADYRWANWESVANSTILNIAGQKTLKEFFQSIILPSLSYVKMSEGAPNPQERKYKVNFTGRYTLQGGKLKGLFFGGNYSWRSSSVLGFATRPVLADEVYREFAGIGAGGYDVPDFSSPYNGRSLTTLDGFMGYKKKFYHGKFEWFVQLNVRNLLNDQELLPQRVFGKKQTDGTSIFWITNYNVPDPRRFILTNTISF